MAMTMATIYLLSRAFLGTRRSHLAMIRGCWCAWLSVIDFTCRWKAREARFSIHADAPHAQSTTNMRESIFNARGSAHAINERREIREMMFSHILSHQSSNSAQQQCIWLSPQSMRSSTQYKLQQCSKQGARGRRPFAVCMDEKRKLDACF